MAIGPDAAPQDEEDELLARAEARVGQVLCQKWTLKRVIGIGGMASVYAAEHRNGKRGAVKILHPELSLLGGARARFLREGKAANTVDHDGVVSVLDDDTAADGSVYLVMELLDGASVATVADQRPGGILGVGEAVAVADQLLDVLAAAHDKGILHRDLKPENLFITKAGRLKVLDFGLARVRELQAGSQRATRTGTSMGTPAFMPPEQALGQWDDVDIRTDLWAVGATLFCLLTGRPVHDAATLPQLLVAVMTKPAEPICAVNPAVPAALGAVIDRALAFDQAARWPDPRSMREALQAAYPEIPTLIGVLGPLAPAAAASQPSQLQGATPIRAGAGGGSYSAVGPLGTRASEPLAPMAAPLPAPTPPPARAPVAASPLPAIAPPFAPEPAPAPPLAPSPAQAVASGLYWTDESLDTRKFVPSGDAAQVIAQARQQPGAAPVVPLAPAPPAAPGSPFGARAPGATRLRLTHPSEPFTQVISPAPKTRAAAALAVGGAVVLTLGAIGLWAGLQGGDGAPGASASAEVGATAAPSELSRPTGSAAAATTAEIAATTATGSSKPSAAPSASDSAASDSSQPGASTSRPTSTKTPRKGGAPDAGTYGW
jgi:hypothetical protein